MTVEAPNLGSESIGRLYLRLAVPAVVAQVANVLYNTVDRIFIGHIPEIGAKALTGVGVCFPVILIISAFAFLAGGGGAPLTSIMMGRQKPEEAEKILGNCTTLLAVFGLLLISGYLCFGNDILRMFGASDQTIGYASSYMDIYIWGTLFVQISLGLNPFISAQGFAKIAMQTILIGAVLNTVLDPIFIFSLGLGVKGAAMATVLSQAVSAIWVLAFLSGPKTILRIRPVNLRLSLKVVLPCLTLGLSPFTMQSTEGILNICFNTSLLKYGGDLAVGTMTILATLMQFSTLILVALAQGAQPIIGFNYGAGNADRVRKAFQLAMKVSFLFSAIIWSVSIFAPKLVAGGFTKDASLIDYTSGVMPVFMASFLVMCVQITCQQTFVALGYARISVFLAVLRKLILLIPFIYILPRFFDDRALAVFLAEPIADLLAITTTAILFFLQFRRLLGMT